jgi:beta-lactamase class A
MSKFLLLINFILLISCSTPSFISDKERETNSRIGVYIKEVNGVILYSYRENERFPFMSTVKTIVAGSVLRNLELNDKIRIPNKNKLITWSPYTKNHTGEYISTRSLMENMLSLSDNTATNLLIEKLGGVAAVNKTLVVLGDNTTLLKRNEPSLNDYIPGSLSDPTSPKAISETYEKLLFGSYLSNKNKTKLLSMMRDNKVSNSLLRSFVSKKYKIADRSGAGGMGSRGIVGVVFPKEKKPLIISVYLTESKLKIKERDLIINDLVKKILNY